jgi:glycosyltransferase involved in cell wall biosynthesis
MKKVLVITYHFPPRPSIGSIRLGGLAKYLSDFGWEPIILTAKLPDDPKPQFEVIQTQDYDLVRHWKKRLGLNPDKMMRQQSVLPLLGGTRIDNVNYKNKFLTRILRVGYDIVAYPDEMKGWYSYAVEAGNELLQKRKIDAMISSSSPVSTHLIAEKLKSRWNIPWIADFRDLWTQDYNYSDSHIALRRLAERHLELRTLSKADALVTVSKVLAENQMRFHKTKPVYVIPNGFDPEEMESTPSDKLTDKFIITYSGSLHGCSRDPSSLFKAVQDLISEGIMDPSHIQIRFYGDYEECLEKLIKHYEIQNIVRQYGLISRDDILKKQRESQLLLLLNWGDPGVLTGKVFEYLAAQRPILLISKVGGAIEELLNETNTGIYAPTVDDIKNFLKRCYSEYISKGEVIYKGQSSKIEKYSHREMAKAFSGILNGL